jgi:lysyl-tRNA synthetase class 2
MSGSDENLEARLALRASTFARIRAFFEARGVREVDTPALAATAVTDPAIASVSAQVTALDPPARFLHTSPEYAMKRLLAAGSGDIYQLCRVFRDGEVGRWHEPEFMLLEWYRVGLGLPALMDEVFELIASVLAPAGIELGSARTSYSGLFEATLGIDPHRQGSEATQALEAAIRERGVDCPAGLSHDALLDLALGALIVPAQPRESVLFVYDYPASQAALAELEPGSPPRAARFEAFLGGLELANGFRELRDPAEQRRRFEADRSRRRAAGLVAPAADAALLAALEHGLPPCTGVAVGVDRLIAIAAGASRLADVVNFPHADEDAAPP